MQQNRFIAYICCAKNVNSKAGIQKTPMQLVRCGLLALTMGATGMSSAAHAQEDAELGKREYMRSCASCHGVTGKGDGPIGKSLTKPPADLTKLSENNKGMFPVSRVYAVIDGRIQIMIHGPRDMPVWGDTYTRGLTDRLPQGFMSKDLADALVRVRILVLVEYLSTLQGK